jgi:sugar O-acyltransferase (sialic acid O-acetyltransferase NeuD family)
MGENKKYVIWGSAGHTKVLAEIIDDANGSVVALFDIAEKGSVLSGVPIYIGESGFDVWYRSQENLHQLSAQVAIGGGRGEDRSKRLHFFRQLGIQTPNLIHRTANISNSAEVGMGCQILAFANIDPSVTIGNDCLINKRASISHDSRIGSGVHLAPGAIILGEVDVGNNVFIGAGAIVLPRLRVGAGAIIGAGAVVTHNVESSTTVIGSPARPILKE